MSVPPEGAMPHVVSAPISTAPRLDRVLGTADLLIYGMVFMVPIAPFAVFGFVWRDARGMVPLAYAIGMVGMVFTALSYAAMSRAFPSAGSVYTYAQRGLGEAAGFFAGWLILLDYILIPALLYVISAAALAPLLPGVPGWAWLIAFVVFNCAVNVLGVQLTARTNRWLLAAELMVVAIFIGMGLWALSRGAGSGALTSRPFYDPAQFSPSVVLGATSIAVLSFLGFDGISTLGEEARDAEHGVARATVLALLLVGVLFMAQTWVAAELAAGHTFLSIDTAFYDIADIAGGSWLKQLCLITVVISNGIANAMAAQSAVSRVLYAMARDGKMPSPLARLHPRFHTPHVSLFAVAAVSLAVGLLFAHRIEDLSRLVNFGALTGFLLLHLATMNHFLRRQRSGRWLRHGLAPLLGLAIIAFVIAEMDMLALTIGSVWLALGAVYDLVLTRVLRRGVGLAV